MILEHTCTLYSSRSLAVVRLSTETYLTTHWRAPCSTAAHRESTTNEWRRYYCTSLVTRTV